jgi:hypothetical protein
MAEQQDPLDVDQHLIDSILGFSSGNQADENVGSQPKIIRSQDGVR